MTSLEELNKLLSAYVRRRNLTFNRDIGEAPMDRYSRHIDRIRMVEDLDWLDECFHNRVIRKVYNDSTISIDSTSYDVPMEFIRMKVEVRYLPDDMANAYILYNGKHYPIRRTNKVENARTRRRQTIDYSKMGGDDHL